MISTSLRGFVASFPRALLDSGRTTDSRVGHLSAKEIGLTGAHLPCLSRVVCLKIYPASLGPRSGPSSSCMKTRPSGSSSVKEMWSPEVF